MASIILSQVGSSAGSSVGGPPGAYIGSRIGRIIGSVIDNKLFGGSSKTRVRGSRLTDLVVQSSTYGKMVPIVYGNARIGGNIIWARPIKEVVTTSSSSSGAGGKGGGGKVSQTTTSYSYFTTIAVAICAGELSEISRIWADAKQLDLSQYTLRTYLGSETQTADTLMQSFEGADKTPAYRGIAYVVFEDFPLADFGNRIPNFTFEVKKKALYADYNDEMLEDMITGMVMIPGGGEFVYDTQVEYKVPGVQVGADWVQQGNQSRINLHNPSGKANALLSLDQLQATCANLEWVSVVVSWFGDTMDAGTCIVMPGVEFQTDAVTSPDIWGVAGFDRSTARQITMVDGSPQYGGTPDDDSIVRYVTELRSRGIKVAFYPLLFMDVTNKPWRGDLTGSATDVATFFTKTNGYNAFINHYANLLDGLVDAFIIGSELKGLTKVTNSPGVYPAVDELVNLAADVKAILGSGVVVTYAADWSEYHHTDGGWYHMDPLWSSPDIDVIGIDAYFPLTDAQGSTYSISTLMDGWTSGEGYDFYYSDPARTTQATLTAPYAWKNVEWFYSNSHVNPDASTTSWVPESKKIWFTEFGFPSVDCCSNQPNVFYDPSSSSSAFPYFSKGRVDIRAQRAALVATQAQWKDSDIVEQMFIWTWDARPFPYWPDLLSVWNDGAAWKTGHWVQGKLGISNLSAIVADLCARVGLQAEDIDVSAINIPIEGYVISTQQSIRDAIEALQAAFFFDAVESDYILRFVPRGGNVSGSADDNDIIMVQNVDGNDSFRMTRTQEVELPKRVNVMYVSRIANYQAATQYAQREVSSSREINTLEFPLVMSDQTAKNIADITLYNQWLARVSYEFRLPPHFITLEPADIIDVTVSGVTHRMRITNTRLVDRGILVHAVAEDVSSYDFYQVPGEGLSFTTESQGLLDTALEILDIPALPGDDFALAAMRFAACGKAAGWGGAAIYRSDDAGANYNRLLDIATPGVIGQCSTILGQGIANVFDEANSLTVVLTGSGVLQSVTELAVLNGANAAVVGDEIIQFRSANLVAAHTYELSGLLRGRLGTEWATATHVAGERFVLLDSALAKIASANGLINLARLYKAVTFGRSLTDTTSEGFTFTGVALKPYAPVHIAGTRDVSDNVSISWVRRTRLGGEWRDNVDVSLSETVEAYEVDIMDGTDVVRTITGLSSAAATYSAADQTTDFGSPQSAVVVRVYQLSSVVGRGYAGEATV